MRGWMGFEGVTSLSGTILTSAVVLGVSGTTLIATYDQWSTETAEHALEVADDALAQLSIAPIRVVKAHAETEEGRLLSLHLLVRGRAQAGVDLREASVEARTVDRRTWLASATEGDMVVRPIQDADRSLLGGILGSGDLAQLDLPLSGLDGVGAHDEVRVLVYLPESRPLDVVLTAPDRMSGIVDLGILERP